jgi:hypothetical protein
MKKAFLVLLILLLLVIIFFSYDNWLNELKHLIDVNHVH